MRNTTLILRDGASAPPLDEDIVLRLTGSGRPPRSEVGSLDDISEPDITLPLPALQLGLISAAMNFCKARRDSSWSAVKSILFPCHSGALAKRANPESRSTYSISRFRVRANARPGMTAFAITTPSAGWRDPS